jgi:NAD(P)-dependent dehydrogenase (short-subunit alcohol dehydrogenase family)
MLYGPDSVVPLDGQVGLVTGGGRGIGEAVARELAAAGMRIAVTGRTEVQVRSVADAIGGLALIGDVSQQSDVERWVAETERRLGPIDLLVDNAAIVGAPEPFWNHPPSEWWRVFEVNVLGAFLCCHAVAAGMVERRRGRIVNVTSGAGYIRNLPAVGNDTSYPASKAALTRFTERLAEQLADHGVYAFAVAPGIVRSEMTASLPDTIPWTPLEAPPRLIRGIAEGRAGALSGRYLHAEHDADLDALAGRADEIHRDDLNVIRLRR